MTFQNIKGILFDLDGTLMNTLTDLANSLNEALRIHGLPERTLDEVRQFVGNGLATLVARAISNGKEHPLYPAVLQSTRDAYRIHCMDNTAPYAGILPLLDALIVKGYALGVVSNKPDAHVKTLCEAHFGKRISAAVGAAEGTALKPAPDALLRAMQMLQCNKENSVYIGDSDVDVLTAQNAGIPCISVLWGFRDRTLLTAAGAQIFAQEPSDILQWF